MRRNEREEIGNTIKTMICTALKGDYADEGMICARECKDKLMKLLRKQILQDTNIKVITTVKTSIEKNLQTQEISPIINNNMAFNQQLDHLFLENQDVIINSFELSPKNHMMNNNNVKNNHKNNLFTSNNKLEKSTNHNIIQDQPVKKKKVDLKRKRKELDTKPVGTPSTVCIMCPNTNMAFKIGSKKFRNHLSTCSLTSGKSIKPPKYYSVTIKANSNKLLYAMEILLPLETGTFYDIDQLLRRRWMECCTQHQSKMWVPPIGETSTKINSQNAILLSSENWKTLASKYIGDNQNITCPYQYDADNPTNCTITFNAIVGSTPNLKKKIKENQECIYGNIILIAHNSPYNFLCSCNQPSTFIECSTNSYKCSNCISTKERYDLTNSPRIGTCLYHYHPN